MEYKNNIIIIIYMTQTIRMDSDFCLICSEYFFLYKDLLMTYKSIIVVIYSMTLDSYTIQQSYIVPRVIFFYPTTF